MKRILVSLLALAACHKDNPAALLACAQQENPKEGPTTKWKADLKLTLVPKDSSGREWVFVLEGTTNIPKEVALKARVYAVEVVNDPVQGKREDEEPLVWEDEDSQPGFKGVEAKTGRFKEEVYHFKRKPWSILYRGRLHYRPRDQNDEVLRNYGEDEWSMAADLRVGAEADYGEELRLRLKETTDDLMTLEKLYNELRKQVDAHKKAFDAAAWKSWKEAWYPKVDEINDRNKLRFSLWAVWMERQAKMRVGGMCELLRRIMVAATDQFEAPKPDLTHTQEMIEGWHNYFEEAIEVIGIDAPLDIERVGPLIHDYEIAYAPLRAGIEKEQLTEEVRRDSRRDCLSTLFKLPLLLQNRKRAYKYVNEISVRFTRLLEALDAEASPGKAAAVKRALEEHDAALRDFKRFAGLK